MLRHSIRQFSSSSARPNLARLTVIGRLGKEVEMSSSSSGVTYGRYALAVTRGRRDDPESQKTSWFNVTVFEPRSLDYLLTVPRGSLLHVEADATVNQIAADGEPARFNLNLVQRSATVLFRKPAKELESEEEAIGESPEDL